ncbi:thioesterase family protein [Aeromicrobium sp. IC_218]|uniref:thioesterase family protein n=1 Tax=Aeromicrobium sp. IC_218 TaxID=2545468 RepID=UPI001F6244B3|nr:thioesterase family protein [Aeromicrobium sp. IC_218]
MELTTRSGAYFERLDERTFRATEHTGGAWSTSEQHVAPALGLLTHLVEQDRDRRRDDGLVVARLSFDILGTMPIAEMDARVEVVRPGRTIELVEATLAQQGRDAVRLRAWLLQPTDSQAVAGTALEPIDPPEALEPWDASAVWPGGFIASAQVRRRQHEPGRAQVWVRTDVPLLAGEPASDTARLAGLLDIANGMTVRQDPREVAFPNVDLTAHLLRPPTGAWLGLDTRVSFGAGGLGATTSVLHDEAGPLGTSTQALTVRPGAAG